MKILSLIDGKFTKYISVFDRGFNYGDGFFETMRWSVIDETNLGKVEFWRRHLKRLKLGCQKINIVFSQNIIESYKNKILKNAIKNGIRKGILKLIITRGVGGRGYRFETKMKPSIIFLLFPDVKIKPIFYKNGVNITFCTNQLSSNSYIGGTKSLNRLDSVLAASEFDEKLYFEGIVTNSLGQIIEGTKTNLFILKNKILYTPIINSIGIKGIVREVIIEKGLNYFSKIQESYLKKEDLNQAESIFLTNSICKVVPVKKINKKKYFVDERIKKLVKDFSIPEFLEYD